MEHPEQKIWALVELFGHAKIAGEVSNYTMGGQSFVRVDVPDIPEGPHPWDKSKRQAGIPGHTRLFGAGAIYSINFIDEAMARASAANIRHVPVREFNTQELFDLMPAEHRARLLAGPTDFDDHS